MGGRRKLLLRTSEAKHKQVEPTLADLYTQNDLRAATSSIQPDIYELMQQVQSSQSH